MKENITIRQAFSSIAIGAVFFKDIHVLWKTGGLMFLIMFLVYGIFAFKFGTYMFFIGILPVAMLMNVFKMDAKKGMGMIYSSLPLTKKDIIQGRYISAFALMLLTLITGYFLAFILSFLIPDPRIIFWNIFSPRSVSAFIFWVMFFLYILIPFNFIFGADKGMSYIMVFMIVLNMLGVIMFLSTMLIPNSSRTIIRPLIRAIEGFFIWLGSVPDTIFSLSAIGLTIILFIISYTISKKWYNKYIYGEES